MATAVQPYQEPNIVPGRIKQSLDQGLSWGDFTLSQLTSKFEETDMGSFENLYDDFARNEITNWGPDTNKFEHEEPRGAVNRRAGYLQLLHYGHRGDEDGWYREGHFDGFGGPEDIDPRGINVDPDFKQLTRQEQARMRFVDFTAENYDQITGGGRSEVALMADQKKLRCTVRDKLKVFDRQLDGQRNGMRRFYKPVSRIGSPFGDPDHQRVQSYGDLIRDQGLTPQRRAIMMCREIIRDTGGYRAETADQDFAFAQYAKTCRGLKPGLPGPSACAYEALPSDMSTHISDSDISQMYKSAGLLMSDIVAARRQMMYDSANGVIDYSDAQDTILRHTDTRVKDLGLILNAIKQDAVFNVEGGPQTRKAPSIEGLDPSKAQSVANHLTPAAHYLNAKVIYRGLKPGGDRAAITPQIVTSTTFATESMTGAVKSAKRKVAAQIEHNTAQDQDTPTVATKYHNYKTGKLATRNVERHVVTTLDSESDASQTRKQNDTAITNDPTNIQHMADYGENMHQERHIAPMGTKYLRGYMDSDDARGSEF